MLALSFFSTFATAPHGFLVSSDCHVIYMYLSRKVGNGTRLTLIPNLYHSFVHEANYYYKSETHHICELFIRYNGMREVLEVDGDVGSGYALRVGSSDACDAAGEMETILLSEV